MINAKITHNLNKPALMVDGHQTPPVLYGLSDIPGSKSNTYQAFVNIRNFGQVGIDYINVDTALNIGWNRVTGFNCDAVCSEILSVLGANPNAKVLVRLHVNPPYWWMKDNIDECVIYRTEQGDNEGIDDGGGARLIANDFEHHIRVSLASDKWIDETCQKLELLCDELISSGAADCLLGIQVACGVYGEWHQWGTDVSVPMQKRFVSFLQGKYKTEDNLKKAWHDENVTFSTAKFCPETFAPADEGIFRNPGQSQYIIDAQECIQTTPPYAIGRFCRAIKSCLPDILTGAFYGYYLGCGEMPSIIGHLKIDSVYNDEYVDFLCGPFCYMQNRQPENVPMQRGLLESSRLRNKLWLTEMDQHPNCVDYLGGDIKNKDKVIATLRRNVLQPLISGQGLWYYDHRVVPLVEEPNEKMKRAGSIYMKRGWWENDYLLKEIRRLQAIAEERSGKKYTPAADVLLVYDTDNFYYKKDMNEVHDFYVQEAVARCSVAYDSIYLNELDIADIGRYKCVIMVNTYVMSDERRETVKSLLRDKTVVWLYGAGYCNRENLSVENLSKTVGMNVIKIPDAQNVIMDKARTCRDVEKQFVNPLFAVDDSSATAYAHYDNGAVAIAQKDNNVYIPLPYLTNDMILPFVIQSGAHRYMDNGDVIMADDDIVLINTAVGGIKKVTLKNGMEVILNVKPYTTAVMNAKTGEIIL